MLIRSHTEKDSGRNSANSANSAANSGTWLPHGKGTAQLVWDQQGDGEEEDGADVLLFLEDRARHGAPRGKGHQLPFQAQPVEANHQSGIYADAAATPPPSDVHVTHSASPDSYLVWITNEVVEPELLALSRARGAAALQAGEWTTASLEALLRDRWQRVDANASASASASAGATLAPITSDIKVLATLEGTSALLSIPSRVLPMVDHLLPAYVRPQLVLLPSAEAAPHAAHAATHAAAAAAPPADPTFPTPRLDARLSTLLHSPHLSTPSLNSTVRVLTGEDQSSVAPSQRWQTRHSATHGARMAAQWILAQAREALRAVPGAQCELELYLDGFAPNIVCVVPGSESGDEGGGSVSSHDVRNSDPIEGVDRKDHSHHASRAEQSNQSTRRIPGAVLLSAHYDSRGSFGNPRAPGGDDDGSGTTMLLAVTRILGEAMRGGGGSSSGSSSDTSGGESDSAAGDNTTTSTSFAERRRREIQLVWFSGEEQGLVGYKHYIQQLRLGRPPLPVGQSEEQVLSSRSSSPPPLSPLSPSSSSSSPAPRSSLLRLSLQTDMVGYRSNDEPLQLAFPDKLSTRSATSYLWSVAGLYAPEVLRGYTPACCSDHQSSWEAGYPATWIFERNGPIADPMYHNSGDVSMRTGYDFRQVAAAGRVVLAGAAGLIWEEEEE